MNRSEILAQTVALMNRRDFTANTALQTTFLNQGVMRIQRELRCPAMEKSVDITINDGYTGLTIPADLLELQAIYPNTADIDDTEKLTAVDIAQARRMSAVTDIPTVYCREGGQWILGPSPAVGSIMHVNYWAELSPLSADTDTNVVSLIAWDLIMFATLVQAAIYFKDQRKDDWEAEYQRVLSDLQDQAEDDDENSGAVVQPAYFFPPDFEFEHY